MFRSQCYNKVIFSGETHVLQKGHVWATVMEKRMFYIVRSKNVPFNKAV